MSTKKYQNFFKKSVAEEKKGRTFAPAKRVKGFGKRSLK